MLREVHVAESEIHLDVLRVHQRIGDYYLAAMPAKDLVSISYSDVRRLAEEQRDLEKYLGIQRPVSPKRIAQIKRYLQGSDATFPTSVILAVDERTAEFEETSGRTGRLVLRPYRAEAGAMDKDIPIDKIAKVIDGQHRIAAFLNESKNWSFEYDQFEFDFAVAIFIGADVSEQANIFATVNLSQTKVNRSLVYDLTELSTVASPHKTCHNVAVALDSEKLSPFHKRIKRLGTATPGRKFEPLTQAAFVEALLPFISVDPVTDRNLLLDGKRLLKPDRSALQNAPFRALFIGGKEIDIAEIVFNYFSAVKKKWPSAWDATNRSGNLLPRSNSFKALMKYLKEDAYPTIVGSSYGRIPTVSEFMPQLKRATLDDRDFTSRVFVPGSGGQSTFLKMLRGQVTRDELLE